MRKEAALVVREQAADPAGQKPFFVLLASIEEGPPVGTPDSTSPGVPWLKVRDNIVESASKNGRTVRLDVGDAWKGVAGFEAPLPRQARDRRPPGRRPVRRGARWPSHSIALVRTRSS